MTEQSDRPVAPQTNRPSSIDDLDDAAIYAPVIDVHNVARLAGVPGALAAIGALVDILQNSHMTVRSEGYGIAVTTRRELAELHRLVDEAGQNYDRGRKLWQQQLDGRTSTLTAGDRYALVRYRAAEGIPAGGAS